MEHEHRCGKHGIDQGRDNSSKLHQGGYGGNEGYSRIDECRRKRLLKLIVVTDSFIKAYTISGAPTTSMKKYTLDKDGTKAKKYPIKSNPNPITASEN